VKKGCLVDVTQRVCSSSFFSFFLSQSGLYLITVGVVSYIFTWSHSVTNSIELLWTSDQFVAETST
jgi:hypothetical protein